MALGVIKEKEKKSLDFKDIKISKNGLASVIMFVVTLVLFLYTGIRTGLGMLTEPLSGYLAFAAVLLSLCGVVLSVYGFKEREVKLGLPITGVITNGLMTVLMVYLFVIGLL